MVAMRTRPRAVRLAARTSERSSAIDDQHHLSLCEQLTIFDELETLGRAQLGLSEPGRAVERIDRLVVVRLKDPAVIIREPTREATPAWIVTRTTGRSVRSGAWRTGRVA
jgi:hypothetical protein